MSHIYKIGTDKFIKLAHSAGKLSPNKIQELKKHGLTFLYIHNEDMKKVLDFSLSLSSVIAKSDALTDEKRLNFWTAPSTLYKVSLAGLFHDIGYKELNRELITKKRALLTSDEIHLIESHVTRGRDIILSLAGIPEDIALIVYQHHEDCLGQGYPKRLLLLQYKN